ncbi:hypothetical protein [Clostridium cochlearium]|uniref:hypothetical protein n=1 Tax=Clostridium cochlearium TaxID=1494 RepID=UPI000A56A765|nr:hypothetical protein [Clostridium cochlearium]MBU5269496.1 hypothetical protein [Clostridium cochlearium]
MILFIYRQEYKLLDKCYIKNTPARLAFKSMIGGFAVSILSAMIVGLITLI